MTESLFGGLIVVVILFYAARMLHLSNYWSGVLAGALPFLAYLGYSSQVAWMGGDVLAIHFVVFMATAAVLGVFGAIRQSKEKMHWAPKLIAAFFAGLVVFNAMLLSISMQGLPDSVAGWFLPNPDKQKLHTAFPGVVPHERNKLYEPHLQRIEEQRNLGWKLQIDGLDNIRSGVAGKIQVTVRDAQDQPVPVERVELSLWRMANSGDDRRQQLQALSAGKFGGDLLVPDPGRWLAEITVTRGTDTLVTQKSLFVDTQQP